MPSTNLSLESINFERKSEEKSKKISEFFDLSLGSVRQERLEISHTSIKNEKKGDYLTHQVKNRKKEKNVKGILPEEIKETDYSEYLKNISYYLGKTAKVIKVVTCKSLDVNIYNK